MVAPTPWPQAGKPSLPPLSDDAVEISGRAGTEDLWASSPSEQEPSGCPSSQNPLGETPPDRLEFVVQDESETRGDARLCGLVLGTGLGTYGVCRMVGCINGI